MTPLQRGLAAAALLAAGMATLAVTACGAFYGVVLVMNNGWEISWMGFIFTAGGLFVLPMIYRSLKKILSPPNAPGTQSPTHPPRGPEESR